MEDVLTKHYKKGETIIAEGDPSSSVFLIINGKVEIFKVSNDKEQVLATQGPGTIFGEMALIDGKKRSATVKAIEDTYCNECHSIRIVKEIEKMHPELKIALKSMAHMIREKNKAIISRTPAPANLIANATTDDGQMMMTEEEIKSLETQQLVDELSNSFIRSLFRVLMSTAFKD